MISIFMETPMVSYALNLFDYPNVKVHTPLPAGASGETEVKP